MPFFRVTATFCFLVVFTLVSCESSAVKSEGETKKAGVNLIQNGTFGLESIKKFGHYDEPTPEILKETTNNGSWQFIVNGGNAGGDATCSVKDGVVKVEIKDPGKQVYAIQLNQLPIHMKFGKKYTVSFDAKADSSRNIYSKVSKVGGDWKAYSADQVFSLTTEFKTFSYEFKAMGTDDKARFEISMGANSITVYVAKVSIIEQ